MTSQFRLIRLSCNIPSKEVACMAHISPQRLSQIETGKTGYMPRNPERLIQALEKIIKERKTALERAERLCETRRSSVFKHMKEEDFDEQ